MARPLPRTRRLEERERDREKVEKILARTVEPAPLDAAGATSGGDEARLRGLPAIGRGVAGAIRGTTPGARLQ